MNYLLSLSLILLCLTSLAQPVSESWLVGHQTAQLAPEELLTSKRGILLTSVYDNGKKLSYGELSSLYQNTPKATGQLKWARATRLYSPVIAIGGVVLGAVALTGKQHTAVINDVSYDYTVRSKAQLVGGVLLLAGGMCLFEFSNDLMARSAKTYNQSITSKSNRNTFKARLRVTPVGLALHGSF